MHAGSAFLENVRILLELRLSVDWWYDIWVWDDHGTQGLGSLSFAIGIGNVAVPSLHDINLAVPQATVDGAARRWRRSPTWTWAAARFATYGSTTRSCRLRDSA